MRTTRIRLDLIAEFRYIQCEIESPCVGKRNTYVELTDDTQCAKNTIHRLYLNFAVLTLDSFVNRGSAFSFIFACFC